MSRRERWSIVGDILGAVAAIADEDGARITAVTTRANLPHDRLVAYLRELERGGLVSSANRPMLTPRGREFLEEYREWRGVLSRFNLDSAGPARGEARPMGPAEARSSTPRERI